MLREFQFNLTVDTASGRSTAYLLELTKQGQWMWIGDEDFGPFDTTLDVSTWLVRHLVKRRALQAR